MSATNPELSFSGFQKRDFLCGTPEEDISIRDSGFNTVILEKG